MHIHLKSKFERHLIIESFFYCHPFNIKSNKNVQRIRWAPWVDFRFNFEVLSVNGPVSLTHHQIKRHQPANTEPNQSIGHKCNHRRKVSFLTHDWTVRRYRRLLLSCQRGVANNTSCRSAPWKWCIGPFDADRRSPRARMNAGPGGTLASAPPPRPFT